MIGRLSTCIDGVFASPDSVELELIFSSLPQPQPMPGALVRELARAEWLRKARSTAHCKLVLSRGITAQFGNCPQLRGSRPMAHAETACARRRKLTFHVGSTVVAAALQALRGISTRFSR